MKKIIQTNLAPAPVGPYNQAVLAGNTLYVSGQIAINPTTNQLVLDNIKSQTIQVLNNIQAILTEAGTNFENVVKTSIFLTDMNDFTAVNEVYATYFNETTAPARETVAVAALPKGVNVEISVIAIV